MSLPVRPTMEDSYLSKKGDDPRNRWKRGLTQNFRAGNPKRHLPNCQSRAGCFINATPSRRPEAVRWAPLVGRPADYLPSGTVGQWLPAPCNGGPNQRAATLEPTTRLRRRLGPRAGIPKRLHPNCHSSQRGTLEPAWALHTREGAQRPQCVKGRGPKDPGVAALHLAQSLGHARVKARGVIGRIGGMPRYAGWLQAQGVGVCCTMTVSISIPTIVICKVETGQIDVALKYITASVEDRSWGLADLLHCSMITILWCICYQLGSFDDGVVRFLTCCCARGFQISSMLVSKLAFSIVLQHFPAIGDTWISSRVRSSPGRWKNPRGELIKHLCRWTSGMNRLISSCRPWPYPAWTFWAYGQVTVFIVSSFVTEPAVQFSTWDVRPRGVRTCLVSVNCFCWEMTSRFSRDHYAS